MVGGDTLVSGVRDGVRLAGEEPQHPWAESTAAWMLQPSRRPSVGRADQRAASLASTTGTGVVSMRLLRCYAWSSSASSAFFVLSAFQMSRTDASG
jgi:hypothetical protein